jgi:hypothetical protein
MTREEARSILATWLVSAKGTKEQRGYIEGWFDKSDEEAFEMAIEALKSRTTKHARGGWHRVGKVYVRR